MNVSIEYFAGLLDSHGRFWLQNDRLINARWTNRFTYYSYRKQIADCLKKEFGGTVIYQKGKSIEHRKNKTWRWEIRGKQLDSFCERLFPFLIFLKEECEIMIEFRKTYLNSTPPKPLPLSVVNYRNDLCLKFKNKKVTKNR